MRNNVCAGGLAVLLVCALCATALGQTAPLESRTLPYKLDSGIVRNTTDSPAVVYSTTIGAPGATWLRLFFSTAKLGDGTHLRITSSHDGAVQTLNREHLGYWRNSSAYFNGDVVLVELVAEPGADASRLVLSHVVAGEPPIGGIDSICGPTDDRILSNDPRTARLVPIGCTAWLINDCQHCFITAGHCISNGSTGDVVEFNVPLSSPGGSIVHPGPEDQYPADPVSIQSNGGGGTGNDWAYFGCFPNSQTGLTAYQAQGDAFDLLLPPAVQGQEIRITGYGTVSSPVSPTWSQVQKTHVGPYWALNGTQVMYTTDTTGGNSGSPIIYETTNQAIGVHTHGGCTSSGGANTGTGWNHTAFQQAVGNPRGVCLCPGLTFTYPGGLPEMILPEGGDTFVVHVGPAGPNTPQPGTAWLHYDDGGGYQTAPMTQTAPNEYLATFPPLPCGNIDFYCSAEDTTGERHTDPASVPLQVYHTLCAYGIETFFEETLDTDPGWTAQAQWAYGRPTGGGGAYGGPDPTSGHTGPNVYGYNLAGDYTNNMPEYHLTSAAIDCTNRFGTRLKFWRWLGVEQPRYDHAYVRVSNNGTTWTTVWENDAEIADSDWLPMDIDISAVADNQPTVYLRWTMGTSDGSWIYCGWNVDDVELVSLLCEAPFSPGDMNCDGFVDNEDIDPFVLAITQGQAIYQSLWPNCNYLNGDINGDGFVDNEDIDPFIALITP